mmetsp:Transcript_5280/g.15301  ORF Transcript_5280/g.15301 Transcript_5280/m.15301 type:complete len:222 (+) Transcript_5280:403-1068(+)
MQGTVLPAPVASIGPDLATPQLQRHLVDRGGAAAGDLLDGAHAGGRRLQVHADEAAGIELQAHNLAVAWRGKPRHLLGVVPARGDDAALGGVEDDGVAQVADVPRLLHHRHDELVRPQRRVQVPAPSDDTGLRRDVVPDVELEAVHGVAGPRADTLHGAVGRGLRPARARRQALRGRSASALLGSWRPFQRRRTRRRAVALQPGLHEAAAAPVQAESMLRV